MLFGTGLFFALVPLLASLPTADEAVVKEIIDREQALHDAERRGDVDYFRRTLPEDFVEIGPGGARVGKHDVVAGLPELKIHNLETSNFAVVRLGRDAALVYYDLDVDAEQKGIKIPPKFTLSSVWVYRDGQWEIVFHQGSQR